MEDEEMEEIFEEEFLPVKIDFDYEFDASRYFDFSREESHLEAREAEMWFDRAGSYPPSPFVAKLKLGDGILGENVSTSPKPNDMEDRESTSTRSDTDMDPELSVLDEKCRGLTFYNHMEKDIRKAKTKSAIKTFIPKSSTLMKPTASQLAKQNRQHEANGSHRFMERFQKPFLQNSDRSLDNLSSVGIQAAKRQKLEGGHLHKVAGQKQQYSLTHKAPQKDGPVDGNSTHTKLKITVPREPDLETAHRAQRMRHTFFLSD
ncbi:TPX2 central domain [Macleaya cordata]|uniref:TPX2 central domain n=1 Tax=Macleaya cordata TaxID=56857 RepID=A0A200QBJ0_MACCD|nr:TPX2 central domain [Macleaya cordata]